MELLFLSHVPVILLLYIKLYIYIQRVKNNRKKSIPYNSGRDQYNKFTDVFFNALRLNRYKTKKMVFSKYQGCLIQKSIQSNLSNFCKREMCE